MSNVYFISPILSDESPLWSSIVGEKTNQRQNNTGTMIAGKISVRDSELFLSQSDLWGFSYAQIIDFTISNGVSILNYEEFSTLMNTPEWEGQVQL